MDQHLERTRISRAPMTARSSLDEERSETEGRMCVDAPGFVGKMAERACPPLLASNHIAEAPTMHDNASMQSIDTGHAFEGIHLGSSQYPSREMLNIRSQAICTYHVWLGQICWTCGPSVMQSHQFDQNESKSQTHCKGMGLKLTARPLKFFTKAVIFQLTYLRHLGNYSFYCSVAFANVVPKNSCVMDMAKVGDPQSLGKLFETGRANYSDTAPMVRACYT